MEDLALVVLFLVVHWRFTVTLLLTAGLALLLPMWWPAFSMGMGVALTLMGGVLGALWAWHRTANSGGLNSPFESPFLQKVALAAVCEAHGLYLGDSIADVLPSLYWAVLAVAALVALILWWVRVVLRRHMGWEYPVWGGVFFLFGLAPAFLQGLLSF